ncbi:hypothetical protein ABZ135_31360 [Streptomyces sp. NPDC006339]|uniref:hypothetical protein n=1 Tax=Streptomyces sp. NPDC006339 TaxID=3156755 RepID=UPI0033B37E97
MSMHKAGDWLTITRGPDKGKTLQVSSVRMFAADNGYYLCGGRGLYSPKDVQMDRARDGGNPCAAPCTARQHDLTGVCDHCLGVCRC